jgi:hypothetical protein
MATAFLRLPLVTGKIVAASTAKTKTVTNTSVSVIAWFLRFEGRGFMAALGF